MTWGTVSTCHTEQAFCILQSLSRGSDLRPSMLLNQIQAEIGLTLVPVQVLTLANGDRIQMTPAMKAMFEPENLNNASPATVSRAGGGLLVIALLEEKVMAACVHQMVR